MSQAANENEDLEKLKERLDYFEGEGRWNVFALDLLASLGDLYGDVSQHRDLSQIFSITGQVLNRLLCFRSLAFLTVDESDSSFVLAYCNPASEKATIQKEMDAQIANGTFAWSLNQNRSVIIQGEHIERELIFHVLATKLRVRGLFIGVLDKTNLKVPSERLYLLSIIIHYTANALESATLYQLLDKQNQNLEATIRQRTIDLERKNQALQDFASIAAHDLQAPLNKIIQFSQRLEKVVPDFGEKGRDYLARIQKNGERMTGLIIDLLELAKATSGDKQLELVDLKQIVSEVVSDLEIQIIQTKGKVEVGKLPRIEADNFQMRQLFQNLISNGLKFQKADSEPHVKITSRQTKKGFWEISVKDNGIGFEMKNIESVMKPFQRLHAESVYEGTGIGLSICHKIVERHEGKIQAESAPGKGTTFTVTLPERQTKTD